MKKPYPGSFILNEVGTRKEMAQAYGVSERTIYRWLNKAAKESGLTPSLSASSYPGAIAVGKFKGTRKELAAKYGISERTAYRWLNKAREEMQAARVRGSYPGESILTESGSTKDLAEKYGVSPRTIQRWKERAEAQKGLRPRRARVNIIPQEPPQEQEPPQSIFDEEEPEIIENIEDPESKITPPATEEMEEIFEVDTSEALDDDTIEELNDIVNSLFEFDLLEENSIFKDMDLMEQALLIYDYLQYQYDNFPYIFYKKSTGDEITLRDVDDLMNLNIWRNEFEFWLANEMEINRV